MAYTKKKAAPANRKIYIVRLTEEERKELTKFQDSKVSKERRQRAGILLKADVGPQGEREGCTDELIAECFNCSVKTVERTRKRFVNDGLEVILAPKKHPAPTKARILDGRAEAQVIALACGPPPEGRARWTYRLLADKIMELEIVESISYNTVWETLKKK